MDEIVLLGATEADVDAVVAGVTTDSKGNAVFTYGETRIVLDGIAPADVTARLVHLGWARDRLVGYRGHRQLRQTGGHERR